jgi:hypothetical protein
VGRDAESRETTPAGDAVRALAAGLLAHPADGLSVLAAVRGPTGEIVDFQYERASEVAERIAGIPLVGERLRTMGGEVAEEMIAMLAPVLAGDEPWSALYQARDPPTSVGGSSSTPARPAQPAVVHRPPGAGPGEVLAHR